MKYVLVILLAILFTAGTLLSPLVALVRPSRVFRAMNRHCGAVYLGFDGDMTISKTCGRRLAVEPGCQPCAAICAALHAFDENHCEDEAN